MQQIRNFQQPLLVEAADDVLEPRRLAPGDAVPLLRRAPMVVVDGLEVVVLVVPARDDGVAAARPREDLREPLRHRADAVTGTTSRRWRRSSTPSSRRSSNLISTQAADHGNVANSMPMYSHGCVTPGKGASCLLNKEPGHLAVLFKFQPDCFT